MGSMQVSSLMIIIGAIILVFSALKTRKIIVLLQNRKYLLRWKILLFLILFFLIFYIVASFVIFTHLLEIIIPLTGLVFLTGALFVYLVADISQSTILSLDITRKSKEMLDDILKYIPHSIVVTNEKNIITNVNESICSLIGYFADEMIGKPFGIFFQNNHSKAIFESPDKKTEGICITKTGEKTPVLISVSFIKKENINASHIYSIEDIASLHESKKRYKLLTRLAPVGFFEADPKGNFTFINPRWQRITGYTEEETLGKEWINTIYEPDRDKVLSEWENAVKGQREFELEFRFLRPDKKIKWVFGIANSILDESKKIRGYIGAITDTTHLKKVELELIESENKYRKLIEEAGDIIYTTDVNGNFTFMNARAKSATGYSPEELLGKNYASLVDPEWREKVQNFYVQQFKNRETETIYSFPVITKQGEKKWIEQAVIILKEGDYVKGFQCIVRDITERKEADEKIKRLIKEIEQNKFKALLESAPDPMVIVDENEKIILINTQTENIFGYSRSDLIGHSPNILFHKKITALSKGQKIKQASLHELSGYKKDGSQFPTEVSINQIQTEEGILTSIAIRDTTDRKTFENKLKETIELEKRSRREAQDAKDEIVTLLESISDGFVSLNKNWEYTYVNKTAGKLLGKKPEELINKNIWEVFPEGVNQPFYHNYMKAARENVTIQFEEFYPPWKRWFVNRIYPHKNGISIFFQEVTQSKITELEKKERLENFIRYQSALLQISLIKENTLQETLFKFTELDAFTLSVERVSVWLFNEDKSILECKCMYKKSLDSHESGIFLHVNNFPIYFKAMEENRMIVANNVQKDHQTSELRDTYLIPNNITSMLDIPIRLQRRILGVLCHEHVGTKKIWTNEEQSFASSVADIIALALESHDRIKAQEETMKFASLVKNSSDFIAIASIAGEMLFLNDAGRELAGIDPGEDITGKKFIDFLPPHSQKKYTEVEIPAIIENGFWEGETCLRYFKTGEEIPVSATSFFIKNPETDLPIGYATIQRDITERIKSNQEIRSLNEMLEQRVIERTKELESFSYSVSHDLRAPLRAINGFSKILADEYSEKLGKEGKRYLNIINSNSKKMGQLIDDLLAFSRIARKDLVKAEFNMYELAKSAADEIKGQNPNLNIKFNIKKLHPAMGERSMIRQVLINLISNAVKYSRENTEIQVEIGSEEKNNEIIYYIKDNGVGFDMKYYEKLFGLFQRLHEEERFEGTGVGLAIVKRIVEKHGGRVWAESKINEGSIFYFTL